MPNKKGNNTTKKRLSGRGCRIKGHAFERDVAKIFRSLYGDGVKRGYQTRSGTEAPDVDGTPFWIECKRGKRTNPKAALKQALEAKDERPPIAICKDDRQDIVVMLLLEDFLDILKANQ